MTFDLNTIIHVLLFVLLVICTVIGAVPHKSKVTEDVVNITNVYPPSDDLLLTAEAIEELAEDIRTNGIIQPILVRPYYFSCYQIIDGTKRFYAAKKAGLKQVPVRIANIGAIKAAEYRLVSNMHTEEVDRND